jgi:hypothetical protein
LFEPVPEGLVEGLEGLDGVPLLLLLPFPLVPEVPLPVPPVSEPLRVPFVLVPEDAPLLLFNVPLPEPEGDGVALIDPLPLVVPEGLVWSDPLPPIDPPVVSLPAPPRLLYRSLLQPAMSAAIAIKRHAFFIFKTFLVSFPCFFAFVVFPLLEGRSAIPVVPQ